MSFNSIEFLIFFPITTILYFLMPHKFRWVLLLAASCVFYMAFIPAYIFILFSLIIIDYLAGIFIGKFEEKGKKKLILILSILSNCFILYMFKYFDFFGANLNYIAKLIHWNYSVDMLNLILPLGLSFHTFQSLSYVIEVYKGNQKPERHFGIYSVYVMFYPQLLAGPIERPQNLLKQLHEKHNFDNEKIASGLKLMIGGFFKKIVIADNLALLVNQVYGHPSEYQGLALILATVFFTLQIYCDFSGYSDIAVGIARVMGFRLMENFKFPYFAGSMTDFWRRWHISLSTWFRDYIYFPMGGSRCSKLRNSFNIMAVFLISGLWHGANWTFVAWGAIHAIYLIIDKYAKTFRENFTRTIYLDRVPVLLSFLMIVEMFAVNCFARIFYRSGNLSDAQYIVTHLFDFNNPSLPHIADNYYIICAVAIFGLFTFEAFKQYKPKFQIALNRPVWADYAIFSFLLWIIIFFGEFGGQKFIYFSF